MKYNMPKLNLVTTAIPLTEAYQEIANIANTGELAFFQIEFSTVNWIIQVELDGNICFELAGGDLNDFTLNQAGTDGNGTPVVSKLGGRILAIRFDNFTKDKIFFNSNCIIKAKKTSLPCTANRSIIAYKIEVDV